MESLEIISKETTGSGELLEHPDLTDNQGKGEARGTFGLPGAEPDSDAGEGTSGSLIKTPLDLELEEVLLGSESSASMDMHRVADKMRTTHLYPPKISGSERRRNQRLRALARGEEPPQRKKNRKRRGAKVPAASVGRECASSSGTKRVLSDGSTPESNQPEGQPSKKLRTTPSGSMPSFRDALASWKVAIAPATYPQDKLTEGQWLTLRKQMSAAVKATKGVWMPRFNALKLERGAMVLSCADQQSKDWVVDTTVSLAYWEGPELKVGDPKEILRTAKIILRTPEDYKDEELSEILRALKCQNIGLEIEDWRVVGGKNDETGRTLVFLIGDEVVKTIKARGYKVYLGLEAVKVKVLSADGGT